MAEKGRGRGQSRFWRHAGRDLQQRRSARSRRGPSCLPIACLPAARQRWAIWRRGSWSRSGRCGLLPPAAGPGHIIIVTRRS